MTRLLAGLLIAYTLFGQATNSPPASPPRFEVASIKPNKSADTRRMITPRPGGRFIATNVPLQGLITFAYHLMDLQLSGAPAWLNSERYDIEAKAAGDRGFAALLPMLQTLLEDRFQFKFHRETKELPVYALVVAKAGKLRDVQGECGPRPDGPPPPPVPGKLPPPACGSFYVFPNGFRGRNITLAKLIDPLSRFTGRPLLDKTNLTVKYDINLEYAPEQGQLQAPLGGAPNAASPLSPEDPSGPSLFTALQEQLGLKLESQKGPVEMIVIDHIEKPSEN